VNPKELDSMTKKMGFPVGSTTLVDEVGVDVGMHVSNFMAESFGSRYGLTASDVHMLNDLVDKGFLGRKSGKGIYIYQEGKKNRELNTEALEIFKKRRVEPKLELSTENIRMRLLSRFTNEAIMILQEGILANPLEGDIGAVFGLGFPPCLGGPFRFADSYGADKLVAKMREFEGVYGEPFTPCQLLLDHAKDSSKKFHKK